MNRTKLDNLATLAHQRHGAKRPSKTDAFDAVLDLVAVTDVPTYEQDVAIATLYAHFLPTVKREASLAKPSKAPQWVQLAVGVKDVRPYLHYLYSDGSTLWGTDGHRLHLMRNLNWPQGHYDRAGVNLADGSVDGRFPDCERIIPPESRLTLVPDFDVNALERYHRKINGRPVPCVILDGLLFDESYVLDALAGMEQPEAYVKADAAPKWPGVLVLCEGNRVAVVLGE